MTKKKAATHNFSKLIMYQLSQCLYIFIIFIINIPRIINRIIIFFIKNKKQCLYDGKSLKLQKRNNKITKISLLKIEMKNQKLKNFI